MGKLKLVKENRTPIMNIDRLPEEYFGLTFASILEEIARDYRTMPETPLPSYIRIGLAGEYPEKQLVVQVFAGAL